MYPPVHNTYSVLCTSMDTNTQSEPKLKPRDLKDRSAFLVFSAMLPVLCMHSRTGDSSDHRRSIQSSIHPCSSKFRICTEYYLYQSPVVQLARVGVAFIVQLCSILTNRVYTTESKSKLSFNCTPVHPIFSTRCVSSSLHVQIRSVHPLYCFSL